MSEKTPDPPIVPLDEPVLPGSRGDEVTPEPPDPTDTTQARGPLRVVKLEGLLESGRDDQDEREENEEES